MELKDFIKNVIVEITKGVHLAKEELTEYDLLINPSTDKDGKIVLDKNIIRNVQNVEFDISVTTNQGNSSLNEIEAEMSTKIFVLSLFSLGAAMKGSGKAEINYDTSLVNRIKFSIPISLPSNTLIDKKIANVRSSTF